MKVKSIIRLSNLASMLLALLFVLSSNITGANAQEGLTTNGCGPEGFGWLVLDSTPFSKCDFSKACDRHDICYGKCLEGGALHGNPTCKDKKAKLERKRNCDLALRNGISGDNPGHKICRSYAAGYHWFVSNLGDNSFKGAKGMSDANRLVYNKFIIYISKHPKAFNIDEVSELLENQAISREFTLNSVNFDPNIPELKIYQSTPGTNKKNIIKITGKPTK